MRAANFLLTLAAGMVGASFGMAHIHAAETQEPWYEVMRPDPIEYTYKVDIPEVTEEDIEEEDLQADLQLLACLVQAEAGNQDLTGKRLVVDVVLNRVADPRWPNTISEVIYEPGQFAPVTDGALADAYYTVTEECYKAVTMELVDQIDYTTHFFCAGGYGYGNPAYKYGGHYFSR